ncbi:MAG: methionyl-tRNA formyltransferase [Chlamydiota bacterium]
MRILFMGTPEFAVPSLDALAGGGQEVCAAATQPDRPRGRNLAVAATPVKRRAGELGLRVLQPADPGDAAFIGEVREMNPDLIAVVAYGNFLPPALWGLPPRGTINLHPSLLPKYRGAAPIPRAILNGDRETGVTVLYLGAGMDAGDIVAQERAPISADDTGGTLAAALARRGGGLLLAAVRSIEKGTAARIPQDESAATFAPKLEKSDGLIDWRLSAEDLARRVRALRPWPGTFTFAPSRGGTRLLKILEASARAGDAGETGRVLRCDSVGIHVGTGSGSLVIRVVQPEGGRAMTALEFVRGTRDLAGTMLGR